MDDFKRGIRDQQEHVRYLKRKYRRYVVYRFRERLRTLFKCIGGRHE